MVKLHEDGIATARAALALLVGLTKELHAKGAIEAAAYERIRATATDLVRRPGSSAADEAALAIIKSFP